MEERKLTQEELYEAEAAFNLASLLGRSIQAAAFQIKHPDYEPECIVWLDKPEPPADDEAEPEEESEEKAEDLNQIPEDQSIHSNEASIDAQIEQLTALYTPGVSDFLKPSALYDMFRLASSLFTFDEEKLAADILTPADKRKMALAWVIVKRVFAVRHPDDTLHIINCTEAAVRMTNGSYHYKPFDEVDKQFITETCSMFLDDFKEDKADNQPGEEFIAEKLEQLKHSNVISSPTSLAFWRQSEAAATGQKKSGEKKAFKIPEVYKKPLPADIELTIAGPEGKPLEITGFDMALQATIGQMIRENNNKPVQATPAQVFRRCAGLDSNASVSATSVNETIESINKMRQADTTILYAQQLDAFLKRKSKSSEKQPGFDYSVSKIEGKLINADRIRTAHVAANGKIIDDVFVFYRAPIIEHYSYGFRQLMEVDKKYLAGALTKSTPENISFARYMLVQINRIKENKPSGNAPYTESLTFEKIAARCVYDISNRAKLRNFQKKVFDYCENLVAMGHIKKVEQYYKGRVYVGLLITV